MKHGSVTPLTKTLWAGEAQQALNTTKRSFSEYLRLLINKIIALMQTIFVNGFIKSGTDLHVVSILVSNLCQKLRSPVATFCDTWLIKNSNCERQKENVTRPSIKCLLKIDNRKMDLLLLTVICFLGLSDQNKVSLIHFLNNLIAWNWCCSQEPF